VNGIGVELNEGSTERFNYFNYFTEVEDEFVRRRGKPLTVSPLDWALIESWKDSGIPLYIVLRGINQAFDHYDARPIKHRKVNSLIYCQQAVESLFADYRQSQTGASEAANRPAGVDRTDSARSSRRGGARFSKDSIVEFIARCSSELAAAADAASQAGKKDASDAMQRGIRRLRDIAPATEGSSEIDAEGLERDLDSIDRIILESLLASTSEKELESLYAEAKKQLRGYKKKMEKAIYEQTISNFIARRLRELNRVPRLSLFYM
jgi:hypothetical protein